MKRRKKLKEKNYENESEERRKAKRKKDQSVKKDYLLAFVNYTTSL